MRRFAWSATWSACVAAALLAFGGRAWGSEDNIETERTLSEILQDKRLQEAKQQGDISGRDTTVEEAREEKKKDEADGGGRGRLAVLPQIGFSPDKGFNGGIKLTDRDLFGLTLDVSGLAAMEGQIKGKTSIVAPDVFGGTTILLASAEYEKDPTKEFFGLGNNEVGPDPLSTNEYQRLKGTLAVALRATSRFTLVGSGSYNEVQIHHGDRDDDRDPFTTELFPDLVGIHGGRANLLSAALIFNDRDDVTRPIRGWNVIAKYERADRSLGNDFEFNRMNFNASYLYPLLIRRQVIGIRIGGEYVDDTRRRHVPFWELSSLGGGDDMRGYFLDRFLGKAKFIAGGEYRLKILDFNFFDIWDVKIDGVGFGDAARVFLDKEERSAVAGVDASQQPNTNEDIRFSYGGGVRFALGEAIVARVDVGFSDEEKGLVYLVFGHTF